MTHALEVRCSIQLSYERVPVGMRLRFLPRKYEMASTYLKGFFH